MGQKLGRAVPIWGRGLGPRLTQCGEGRGLPACQVSSLSIQPSGQSAPTLQTGQRSDSIGRTVLGRPVRPMLPDRCLSVLSVTLAYCGQTVGRITTKLGMQVGLGPGYIVLDGDLGPPPPFSAHICCGQMARWNKMALSRKVGLDPSDIVLDGDPAPPFQKGDRAPPNFRPMSIVSKRLDGSKCNLVRR